jgi:hypothetical protein
MFLSQRFYYLPNTEYTWFGVSVHPRTAQFKRQINKLYLYISKREPVLTGHKGSKIIIIATKKHGVCGCKPLAIFPETTAPAASVVHRSIRG